MVKGKWKSQISEIIESDMKERGLSIKQVAEKLDTTYEHVRSMVRGTVTPSKFMSKALSDILGEDTKEFEKVCVADRIRHRHGDIVLEITGKNPELEQFERAWKSLSDEHKADIIAMAQTYARRDKEVRK